MVVEDPMTGKNGNSNNGDFPFFGNAKVDITEGANLDRIRYGQVESISEETTESLSSFEESISGADDSDLYDDATSSLQFGDVSEFLGLRKKVTPQWRGFVRQLTWRCKWAELQMVKLRSLARKYDRELAQYNARKKIDFMSFEPDVLNSRSVPFCFASQRNMVLKRKKRRRHEESDQDIADYMSKHCLFSFYENGKLGCDGDNQVNSALVSSEEEEAPLKRLRRNDRNDPMEQLLRRIGSLQSRVETCKAGLEKIRSENGSRIRAHEEPGWQPSAADSRTGMTEQPPPPPLSIAAQLLAACGAGIDMFDLASDVLDNGESVTELTEDSRVVGTRVNNEEVFMIYDQKIKERLRSFQEGEMEYE